MIPLLLCIFIACVAGRSVSIYTQTNISASFLSDPGLSLPFTSIFYISAGSNSSAHPPVSIRIAQIQDFNSTAFSPPTLTIIEHQSNFSMPSLLNMPAGVAWHELYIGELSDDDSEKLFSIGTYGTGIFLDLWVVAGKYTKGYYTLGVADENTLFRLALIQMGLDKTDGAKQFGRQVDRAKLYYAKLDTTATSSVELRGRRYVMKASGSAVIIDFEFSKSAVISGSTIEGLGIMRNKGLPVQNAMTEMNSANKYLGRGGNIQPTDDPKSLRGSVNLSAARSKVAGAMTNVASELEITTIRQGGKLATIATVSKAIADAAVAPFLLLASVFLILDFVHQQWQVGAIGTGILLIGVLAPILFDNPVGWFIGGLLALFFTLSPGLGKPDVQPPILNNATSIIQYKVWGNRDKTGNEDCEKTQKAKCTVSYGAGLFSKMFGWEYFDGVAFLLWANDGFPMTIPDIAKFFTIQPIDANRNKSAPAEITCGVTKEQLAERFSRFSMTPMPRYNLCDHPKMWINRTSIRIARLNATAAEIYDRIIKGPGQGDCKIVDNSVNPVTIPEYGFKIKGLPVAIACGIKAVDSDATIDTASVLALQPSEAATIPAEAAPPHEYGPPSALQGGAFNQSGLGSYDAQLNSAGQQNDSLVSNVTSQEGPNIGDSGGIRFNLTSPSNFSSIQGITGLNSSSLQLLQQVNATIIQVPAGSNPANQSTDGRAGEAYVPPPPPAAFQQLLSSSFACFNYKEIAAPFCLPNGTYGKQSDTFLFTTSKVTSVASPYNTTIKVTYQQSNPNGRGGYVTSASYSGNQTGALGISKNGYPLGLLTQMSRLVPYTEKVSGGLDIFINADAPPHACFYTSKQYKGEVFCLGQGGGNLTNMQSTISSVDIRAGAVVTLFPNKYGDPGSQKFTVSVPDLATAPYGTNGNMIGRVQAVLIENSTHGIVARDHLST